MDFWHVWGYDCTMDILTDTLNLAGLKSRLLNQRELKGKSQLQFPCSRSIGFHVVLKGEALIHAKGKKAPIRLQRGDIALMARGQHHAVSTEGPALTIVSGAYQLWNDPVHPFFAQLPEWYVLTHAAIGLDDGLGQMLDLLARESARDELGRERIIQSILDVMFSLIMRRVLAETGARETNWAHSIQHREIRRALELLHTDLQRDWGLDDLAKAIGVSRSGLAARFKKLTGDSPMHYLATLRTQKAITLLTTTDQTVEEIAFEVGHKDSFTFSKAFKKITGLAPREYRRQYADAPGASFRIS